MAPDPPTDAFVATLRRSRLLESGEVDRVAKRAGSHSSSALADELIRVGELTHYQADKLLRGLWQGLVIGPYSVLAPLGRGGMGTVVYLARDRRIAESLGDSVLVALKLLPNRKGIENPKALARFRREMELGRRVNHPNVVRTLAAGEQAEVHYLALEFVPGKTLRQLVAERGPLPAGDAARIGADAAAPAGLAHVHARGLVHRDVKPSNVMVRPDGSAVLLDLGLAIAPGEPLPDDPAIAGGRGYVVGTMDYLAPEQAEDSAAVGPPADLYGLGCALFLALTGSPPFPAEGAKAKILRHRRDPVPLIPTVPREFARLVQRLMAKSPADRPRSAAEVRELFLPWARATERVAGADALAAADAPGLDAGLWEAAPGDDVPATPEADESESFARLEADAGGDALPDANRVGLLLLAMLGVMMGLVLTVAVLRRL